MADQFYGRYYPEVSKQWLRLFVELPDGTPYYMEVPLTISHDAPEGVKVYGIHLVKDAFTDPGQPPSSAEEWKERGF